MKVTNPVITLAELEENYACSGMRDRFRHLCGERLVLTEARARRLGPIFGHSAITWVMVSLIMSPSLYRQAWTRHERIKRRARRKEISPHPGPLLAWWYVPSSPPSRLRCEMDLAQASHDRWYAKRSAIFPRKP